MVDRARYIVVGGGLAGGSAVEAIRERDPVGRLMLVTEEKQRPYDRVPLSKTYLTGRLPREGVFLKKPEFYEHKHIELLIGRSVKRLNLRARTVLLDDGQEVGFERLLIASGGRPKKLPIPGGHLPGIHYLRTLEDCEAIKAAMVNSGKAVVIGGGFIGCEVAAAFATKGLETTIIELGPYLLNMAIDEETGRWITKYFEQQGVRVLTGVRAASFVEGGGHMVGVQTEHGELVRGSIAVVGVGINPNEELAQEAGLKVDNGIMVNEHLETEVEGVFAAGDVARFYSPIFGHHLRVEHYDVAVKHGRLAGANMTGAQLSFTELPFFFSYMFALRTLVYGDMSKYDQVIRRGALQLTERGGFMRFYLKDGRVNAFLALNRGIKEMQAVQRLILSRRTFEDTSILADESVDLQGLTS